jgi:hypothetical protein
MNFGILSKLIIVELFLLFVQFGVGMINNLFVNVPLDAPFKFLAYSGGLYVFGHVVNGVLILLFAFTIIWFSFKRGNSLAIKLSVIAVVFTVSAIVNGIIFLEIFSIPALYNTDNYFSLAMAVSFLAVFTTLFAELYVIKNKTP